MASRAPPAGNPPQPVERVRAALSGGVADRLPAAWWGHTFQEEWSPSQLAAVTGDRQRRFGWDFVKLQPRATCFAEAFGSRYRPSGQSGEGPVLVRPAVRADEGWRSLARFDASVAPLADQVEALRMVVKDVGPGVPVLQTVFSPLTVAGYLTGEDRIQTARQLLGPRDVLPLVLERIAETLVDFVRRSLEAGAAGIFYAISGMASEDVMPQEDYEARILESDLTVLSAAAPRGWFNVLHLCGPRLHFDLARTLPGHAVSWSVHEPGNPGLADGMARSGKAAMGGVDHAGTLVDGSVAAVEREVRAAIAETRGRALLLAPGCSVPPTAPGRNIEAVMEAARRV